MRVLVTGGRDFADQELVESTLGTLHRQSPLSVIIHGDARGADRLCGQWAEQNGIESIACPADWKRFGRGAGVVRNRTMLEEHAPDLLVAFPGGKGTADMVRKAESAGLRVLHAKGGPED